MSKKILLLSLVFLSTLINAQKNLEGLISAEKNFAAYSVTHGTKDAFLKFLDSSGVVFDQGKPVNGITIWTTREKRPGLLKWEPEYAEIASSKDFGYTSGPWTFQRSADNDTIVARGQYTTVWHTDVHGEWKSLLDLGVGGTPKNLVQSLDMIHAKKIQGGGSAESLVQAEENFINAFQKNRIEAYTLYLSDKSILNRNGLFYPASNKKSQTDMIQNTPSTIQFHIDGSGMASSGDLGYVYGSTLINDKPENFLHIWRNEKQGWKIALEVLRY